MVQSNDATRDRSTAKPYVSIRATWWVWREAPVPADLVLTLLTIAAHCDPDGRGSRASVPTLVTESGLSRREIFRDIKDLKRLGLIVARSAEPGKPVVYDLPIDVLKGPKPASGWRPWS